MLMDRLKNKREMLLGKVNRNTVFTAPRPTGIAGRAPFAGITLTRFCGYDLRSSRLKRDKHPGKTETKAFDSKAKNLSS